MSGLRAGRLQYLVRVQSLKETVGSDYAPTATYVTRRESWAAIQPLSSTERVEAQKVKGFTSHKIVMHYDEDAKPTDRVLYNDRVFDVEGVIHSERHGESTTLTAVEVFE